MKFYILLFFLVNDIIYSKGEEQKLIFNIFEGGNTMLNQGSSASKLCIIGGQVTPCGDNTEPTWIHKGMDSKLT